jgi:hypothetical protein
VQAIADTGPLGDDLVASVDEELEVGLEVGLPEPWEARLAQGDPGDRDRVARIILAPTAAGPPAIGGQVRRDVDDFLVEGEEPPAQGQAEPPRALDGDEARTVEGLAPRPMSRSSSRGLAPTSRVPSGRPCSSTAPAVWVCVCASIPMMTIPASGFLR